MESLHHRAKIAARRHDLEQLKNKRASQRPNERAKIIQAHKRKLYKEGSHACEACSWTPAPQFLELFPCKIKRHTMPCLEIHHVIPVSCGGDDTPANLVQLCPNCHAYADIMSARMRLGCDQPGQWLINPHSKAELLDSLRLLHADPEQWHEELQASRRECARTLLDSLRS